MAIKISKTKILVQQHPLTPAEYKQLVLTGRLPVNVDSLMIKSRNKWINLLPLTPSEHKAMVLGL